ncbi:hypothetical protein Pst134EA_023179 [Puccinia striiformis f. sp. tritici]|uniref:hypothetical protein n=1 Tax=Puccinia striiformis f. sp. tritici TaxID=168172 RepID=UPI00200823D8|nr:hypothetical protein Pst134EA_023179 [Puccinia striiformis f. sp. tritici]KAH9455727.1 hypothetical protein Pst134EA_023179 [Puccinia striiformis f. sp. tritici]
MQRPRLTRILQRTRKLRHQHRRYSRTSTEPTRVAIHVWSRISGFLFCKYVDYSRSINKLYWTERSRSISLRDFLLPLVPVDMELLLIILKLRENCELLFAQVAEHPRFRYYGNTIVLEEDAEKPTLDDRIPIRLKTLKPEYDVVLLSYGVGNDTIQGGIPGEENSSDILPGRAAVEWYNGYPTDSKIVDQVR